MPCKKKGRAGGMMGRAAKAVAKGGGKGKGQGARARIAGMRASGNKSGAYGAIRKLRKKSR